MKARPRQTVLAGDQILVEGLVLVPKDNHSQLSHDVPGQPNSSAIFQYGIAGSVILLEIRIR
jgi:hypothetical protein